MDLTGEVKALRIPKEGPVLFVLKVGRETPHEMLAEAGEQLRSAAHEVAPGRGQGVVLAGDLDLQALSASDLRTMGLRRINGWSEE